MRPLRSNDTQPSAGTQDVFEGHLIPLSDHLRDADITII
jgi:hypothetical protein